MIRNFIISLFFSLSFCLFADVLEADAPSSSARFDLLPKCSLHKLYAFDIGNRQEANIYSKIVPGTQMSWELFSGRLRFLIYGDIAYSVLDAPAGTTLASENKILAGGGIGVGYSYFDNPDFYVLIVHSYQQQYFIRAINASGSFSVDTVTMPKIGFKLNAPIYKFENLKFELSLYPHFAFSVFNSNTSVRNGYGLDSKLIALYQIDSQMSIEVTPIFTWTKYSAQLIDQSISEYGLTAGLRLALE